MVTLQSSKRVLCLDTKPQPKTTPACKNTGIKTRGSKTKNAGHGKRTHEHDECKEHIGQPKRHQADEASFSVIGEVEGQKGGGAQDIAQDIIQVIHDKAVAATSQLKATSVPTEGEIDELLTMKRKRSSVGCSTHPMVSISGSTPALPEL
ncbi:hypothetical protein E1B28_006813 [Marasmius oreades]|uniref:Uncharacterized protein n=1 Tax=Marasmius oreades TaxID=181124 RepID=A0A9P7UWZ4_9AGAR|nr:uncharacterized protein E1B28_006813 [Marasmius oreades]KAG7096140.1 hypothetical protein E1B28_006813 [Marasmius oreades]